jgi:hypothetical protein
MRYGHYLAYEAAATWVFCASVPEIVPNQFGQLV